MMAVSGISSEVGDEKNVCHQRNNAKDKENYIEWIDKSPPQPAYCRIIFSIRKPVRTIFFPSSLRPVHETGHPMTLQYLDIFVMPHGKRIFLIRLSNSVVFDTGQSLL